jgi:hypothetical protein
VAEAVGDLVDRDVEHQQVGALADLDRAERLLEPQRPGRVQRRSRQRLERRHLIQPRAEPDHLRHRHDRRRPGVRVGRQHDQRARVEQRPPRRAVLGAEELGRRQQDGGAVRSGQWRDVLVMQRRQVID